MFVSLLQLGLAFVSAVKPNSRKDTVNPQRRKASDLIETTPDLTAQQHANCPDLMASSRIHCLLNFNISHIRIISRSGMDVVYRSLAACSNASFKQIRF